MGIRQLVAILGGSVVSVISISTLSVYLLMKKIYNDIKPQKPSKEMFEKQEANMTKNALFNLFPILKTKIAWLSLGTYPSVVDKIKIKLPRSGKRMVISLKREDLVSNLYGGNKVRTLEYQLACCKLQLQEINKNNLNSKNKARMISVGGSGSNQIVAASVYSNQHKIPLLQYPFDGECESFDNGLNFVSQISFPDFFSKPFWSLSKIYQLRYFYHTFLSNKYNNIISMPGGANVTGALGHINAILELVEQINNGHCVAPAHIFLPLGSSCTTAGLAAGLALIRHLNIGHSLYDTQIHAIGIHNGMDSIIGHKIVNSVIRKISNDVLVLIHDLVGINATKELEHVYNKITFSTKFAGEYGEWTDYGLLAKEIMMNGKIMSGDNPIPWMCSCFTSKAFAAMIDFMHNNEAKSDSYNNSSTQNEECQYMLWCTKSAVQPILNGNAAKQNFIKLTKDHKDVSEWLEYCHINVEDDYLSVMSKL